MKRRKVLEQALSGLANVRFTDMVSLAQGFGQHQARVKGSHHIFVHAGVRELLNLQNVGGKAKPYQVRQFLELVERYNLSLDEGT